MNTTIPVRRRRTGGKKSRTGCRTCRLRHVKCDEAPGSCQNCGSTGRVCDGYVHRLPVGGHSIIKTLASARISADVGIGFRWVMTSDERRCFSFFQHHTVPTFLEFFESSLWQNLVLQMSQSDPAVFHAAVALSAIHQDTEAKGMPLAAEIPFEPGNTLLLFAQDQLGRAFNLLTRRHASHDPTLRNVTLLCCLLFVLADLLWGHYDSALNHLQSGLRILQELQADRELVAPTARERRIERCLVAAFAHLDILSAHFGVGGPLLCIDALPANPKPITMFNNMKEARDAFEPILSAGHGFIAPCMGMADEEIAQNYDMILPRQFQVWSRFSEFVRVYKIFYRESYARLTHKEQRSADIIYLQCLSLSISIRTCVLGENNAALAYYTSDLEAVVCLAEAILKKFPTRPTFTMDIGVIAPLYHASIASIDYRVRWRAIRLLHSWPHREGPFDSNWVALLAEELLKRDLLAQHNLTLEASPYLGDFPEDPFSPAHILHNIQVSQRHRRMLHTAGPVLGEADDGNMSPDNLIGSSKCMTGWSCIRAYRAVDTACVSPAFTFRSFHFAFHHVTYRATIARQVSVHWKMPHQR
ncbi:unnamed protein product [Penicillium nalgiovense]|uniref:Zn(2)-C6 fungal-type domain-containing protein n=1 Tax=Penicillium nalgiovense TaxID=60175 RepID=A0A9W4IP28_PENNA|nr:unnamed protein product [Penicillium nalgiovense]CAG7961532.1 unnamed protein product [Penicillium nalgiovense]CAG7977452.1 unnamed protein product [Penicillium nalgiovense]CAG7983786.1 unnamed protein product [Penicillium nalgiovense]CAG7993529.1 unnamed protein product [Penicillium nalgiovense]